MKRGLTSRELPITANAVLKAPHYCTGTVIQNTGTVNITVNGTVILPPRARYVNNSFLCDQYDLNEYKIDINGTGTAIVIHQIESFFEDFKN